MGMISRLVERMRNKGTLSFEETCALLGESPRYVRRITENGFMRPIQKSPYRYSTEEVADYMEERRLRQRRLTELIESGEDLYADE